MDALHWAQAVEYYILARENSEQRFVPVPVLAVFITSLEQPESYQWN
jgi:hypothetical protein